MLSFSLGLGPSTFAGRWAVLALSTSDEPPSYLRIRKRIEEPFGWIKTVAGGRKQRHIGLQRNGRGS
jgi:hypothetical protein